MCDMKLNECQNQTTILPGNAIAPALTDFMLLFALAKSTGLENRRPMEQAPTEPLPMELERKLNIAGCTSPEYLAKGRSIRERGVR
jgi:hypothetical protein